MFVRLRAWLSSWFVTPERFDLYHPKEREIYCYWDGQKEVKADPMVLYRRVMDVGPELSVDFSVAQSPSKDRNKAAVQALDKVRKVFNVKSFEEGGLTEDETFELFDHLMHYCMSVKKNSSLSVTSSSSSPASSSATGEANFPTSSSSDSGSIAGGSASAKPTPSPSEQPSPLVP